MTRVNHDASYQLKQAKAFIEEHHRFLVVAHIQPDGDAISSTCAIAYLLEHLGKSYVLMNESPLPPKFAFLYGSERIQQFNEQEVHGEKFDAIITLDCADAKRLGKVEKMFSEQVPLLNIDHHPTNDFFGSCQLIDPQAAATVEVLYDLLSQFELAWDERIATCIYTGLLTDTGGFRYANTTSKVMQIAAEMLQTGVKGHELAERLLERTTHAHVQVLKRALATLQFAANDQVCWMSVKEQDFTETGATNDDLEGLISYPRNIEGVKIAVLFKELGPQEVKVSLRSSGEKNVAKIAQHFGGGGHVLAAGVTMSYNLEQSISLIIDQVVRSCHNDK